MSEALAVMKLSCNLSMLPSCNMAWYVPALAFALCWYAKLEAALALDPFLAFRGNESWNQCKLPSASPSCVACMPQMCCIAASQAAIVGFPATVTAHFAYSNCSCPQSGQLLPKQEPLQHASMDFTSERTGLCSSVIKCILTL